MNVCPDEEEVEVLGQRKMTKADIEKWILDNSNALGLDWRVGFQFKFKDSGTIYRWLKIKDSKLGVFVLSG